MKKIVYFDEESALDYIILKDNGKKVTETITKLSGNLDAKLAAEFGDTLDEEIQNKIISFIQKVVLHSSFGIGGKVNGEINKYSTTTINNTVLTDYIKKASRDKRNVKKFSNINIEVYPLSMAYYRLYTPYMELIDGAKNYQGIDLTIIDKVLTSVKGYIEVISINDKEKVVLRFNNNTFRDNYKLSDILKMNLDIYAVKVGRISESKLNLNNEIIMQESSVTADEILSNKINATNREIDVYDVVLAGVSDE
ncbi:MAG: hypothetical protein IJ220_06610 [Clostridia bacterium]|nr:hypothetical protein [Clostridia bacterium]